MKRDMTEHVLRCLVCQQVKIEHQRPRGPLQQLEIPQWKWEYVTMDFLIGLPRTRKQHNAIWIIVDRLTKSAHFLVILQTDSLEWLAQIYIDEIVRLHGVPIAVISD